MKTVILAVLLLHLPLASHGAERAPDTIDSELGATLESANQSYIQAVRSNDPAKLSPYFSGEVLAALSQTIKLIKEQGLYEVSELQGFRWHKVRAGEKSAQISTTERWKNTYRMVGTNKCAFVVPAHEVRQTYHLEKRPGGWTITKIVDDPGNKRPKPTRCP